MATREQQSYRIAERLRALADELAEPPDEAEIVERFCALATKVRDAVFPVEPSDCFCRQGKNYPAFAGGFEFNAEIIDYIESAVNEALAREHLLRNCDCRDCAVCGELLVVCGKCGMCTRCHNHKPGCPGCRAQEQADASTL